jgi:hypothetical protein
MVLVSDMESPKLPDDFADIHGISMVLVSDMESPKKKIVDKLFRFIDYCGCKLSPLVASACVCMFLLCRRPAPSDFIKFKE